MAKERNALTDSELEAVTGGKKHHKTKEDVPDAEFVNEQLETFKHSHCPDCGSRETWDKHFCIFDGDYVYPGKECRRCGKKWLTGKHM